MKSTVSPQRLSVRDNPSRTNNVLQSFHFALRSRVKVAHPNHLCHCVVINCFITSPTFNYWYKTKIKNFICFYSDYIFMIFNFESTRHAFCTLFSTPALPCRNFHSRIFHPCLFLLLRADISTPAFSTHAFSVPPIYAPRYLSQLIHDYQPACTLRSSDSLINWA